MGRQKVEERILVRAAHEFRSKVARWEMSSRSPAVTREQYCL